MLRPPTNLRPVLRAGPRAHPRQSALLLRRTLFSQKQSADRLTDELDVNRLNSQRRDYEQNRTAFLAAGAVAGIVSFIYTAWKLKQAMALEKDKRTVQCDAPSNIPTETFKTEAGEKRKVVVLDDEGREVVPTGNATVPAIPRTLLVDIPPSSSQQPNSVVADAVTREQGAEFTLVGLGTRTVTFLGFEVYVMGFYVATQDIARLQHHLIKKINPVATTLIPSEKDALRRALRDATEGEETWNTLLVEAGCRSIVRITPVRDTDFHHLRDAFVRAITNRTQRDTKAYADEAFGLAVRDLKSIMNRGSLKKRAELLLCRDDRGKLTVLFDPSGKGSGTGDRRELLGSVDDDRLSRLLWLNWLAGSKVASEKARENIIEGVMEFVERPVGTVATQVV
ncbi:Altered inheritance of mitochondria protein 18 [Paramyrothecium foliicola]|nr:Altered inheritance of mitochondria protein 18 [Paramyrothecium foliicola]